ncbi:MAG: sulfur oxidation c-type cytochrome SoxX [Gammaproteobacteria bacterium]|nr:sulfur oxidation c-type cytochrome SoxX [Gammaproteobacteria bacterium]
MRHTAKAISTVTSIAALLGSFALSIPVVSNAAEADDIAQGKKIAFDRKKGNCLACHYIEGGALPGNIGPPLIAMKGRFPDKSILRAQIWDSRVSNPNTLMPPFGPHEVMSKSEIDQVVEFIYSL